MWLNDHWSLICFIDRFTHSFLLCATWIGKEFCISMAFCEVLLCILCSQFYWENATNICHLKLQPKNSYNKNTVVRLRAAIYVNANKRNWIAAATAAVTIRPHKNYGQSFVSFMSLCAVGDGICAANELSNTAQTNTILKAFYVLRFDLILFFIFFVVRLNIFCVCFAAAPRNTIDSLAIALFHILPFLYFCTKIKMRRLQLIYVNGCRVFGNVWVVKKERATDPWYFPIVLTQITKPHARLPASISATHKNRN